MIRRVLLVDDNVLITKMFETVFGHNHCEVVCANSGQEGFEKLIQQYKEPGFGLVLTDLCMPGMNGIELIRQIRAYEASLGVQASDRVRTAIFTGYGNQRQQEAYAAGCNDFLLKPVSNEELVALVGSAA